MHSRVEPQKLVKGCGYTSDPVMTKEIRNEPYCLQSSYGLSGTPNKLLDAARSFRIDLALIYAASAFAIIPPAIFPVYDGQFQHLLNIAVILLTIVLILMMVCRKECAKARDMGVLAAVAAVPALLTILDFSLGYRINEDVIAFSRILSFGLLCLLSYKDAKWDYLIKTYTIYGFLLVAGNLIIEVVLPSGIITGQGLSWQNQYLLRNANTFAFYYVFISAISFAASYYSHFFRKLYICELVIELLSYLILGDATSMTGLLLVVPFMLLIVLPYKATRISKYGKAIAIIVGAFLVVSVILGNMTFIYEALGVFGIDAGTLRSRFVIWQNALSRIESNSFLGFGTNTIEFSMDATGLARSAHNTYLQLLYFGGAIGLCLLVVALCSCLRRAPIECFGQTFTQAFAVRWGVILYLVLFYTEQNVLFPGFYLCLFLSYFFLERAVADYSRGRLGWSACMSEGEIDAYLVNQ